MARPLRLEYAGAVYHVMARGQERSSIFRDAGDRERFLALVGSITRDEAWGLHAYCLMGNHYHLLIETPRGGLSRGMRSLNGRYTQWFNRKHRRHGHLFEGRFKSVLVQKEGYLLELARYLVLNPVRAGLVSGPGEWGWSSYRATVGRTSAPDWLEVDWVLEQFARSRSDARKAYRRFVSEGIGSKGDVRLERRPYLGDQDFLKRIADRLEGRELADEIPLRYRRPVSVGLEAIRAAVSKQWGVPVEDLSRPRGGAEKKVAIYLARKLTALGGREIGRAFGVKPARVSNIVTEIETGRAGPLARQAERLRARLERGGAG